MTATDLVVIGSGPGGYAAAARAADLGMSVLLVERHERLGGVCLHVGCIPSKTLLHAAALVEDAREWGDRGVIFGPPRFDLEALRTWKDEGIGKLSGGLAQLAERRGIAVSRGEVRFTSGHTLEIEGGEGIRFSQAVVATGSRPASLPVLPEDPRVWDSTRALALPFVPARLLVIGGGVLGLELGTVYRALGSSVTVAEMLEQVLGEADADLARAWRRRNEGRFAALHTQTRVEQVLAREEDLAVRFSSQDRSWDGEFDAVLVAVGRVANTAGLGLDRAGIATGSRGEIPVNHQQRTQVPHLFAVGDVTGGPMLAHRATHQGRVAAEVAAGGKSAFDARVIPAVAYTDPEVAWVGLTERQARQEGIPVARGVFPWAASGRAVGIGRTEGLTRLLFDPDTRRVLGAGVAGVHAGELIGEAALAIEMGCEMEDLGATVHPHPTFCETLAQASDVAAGTATELYSPRRPR